MDDSPTPKHQTPKTRDSPVTAHEKVLECFNKQLKNAWITKEEFMSHVADCNERFKDQMMGSSTNTFNGSKDGCGSSVSKRKRVHETFQDDEEGDSKDELTEKNADVGVYLSKTCRTFVYLQKKNDPSTTKMVAVKNTFTAHDTTETTMWQRMTRTSKYYKCMFPGCARRDAFNMLEDRMQKINNHNKGQGHLKCVIKALSLDSEWEAVPFSKEEYKRLEEKHKAKRTIEDGKSLLFSWCIAIVHMRRLTTSN